MAISQPPRNKPSNSRKALKKLNADTQIRVAKSLEEYPIDLESERLRHALASMGEEFRGLDRYVVAAALVIAECLRIDVADPDADPFFEYESPAGPHSHYYTSRLMVVGETLWRLRGQRGFAELCRRLRTREKRSAFQEVIAARLMLDAGFEIIAKPEVYKRGEDFDFTATRCGQIVNVEATALEPAQYSSSTLQNALETKRKQLPANAPAIIFCGYPMGWDSDPAVRSRMMADVDAFFQRTERINAVVLTTEERTDALGDEGQPTIGLLSILHWSGIHGNPRMPADLAFLIDGTLDNGKRNALANYRTAPLVMKEGSEFHKWVDGFLEVPETPDP